MPRRDDTVLLRDILDAIDQIGSYLVNVSYQTFIETPLLQDGVMHRLEIIGEASRNLSEAFREQHSDYSLAGYHRDAQQDRARLFRSGFASGLGYGNP